MIVTSIRHFRNVRYLEIIRVLYRMNCIIKIQKWWRTYRGTGKQINKQIDKQIDILVLR
jgi:hypothetical protein